jgi:hypothetical protein
MALKSLNTLVKLHKRRIDIMRREMLALEEQRKQLLLLSEKLHAEHLHEMELAANEPKMAGFFGAYSARMKERQERIKKEVTKIDVSITEKSDLIREEFSEQKKYEIARENVKKRMDAKVKASLAQRFDEIGTQQYLKLKENPV